MERELSGLRREPQTGWSLLKGVYFGEPVLWVISGIGRKKAEQAVEGLLRDYPIDTIIFLGFGGGLAPELKAGDLVLCRKMMCEEQGREAYYADSDLIELGVSLQNQMQVRIATGDCLTTPRILTDPNQRKNLYMSSQAEVVDMENYWIAHRANQHRLRFLAVRAISDIASERLPSIERFLGPQGEFLANRGIRHFISHPRELSTLPRLYQNSKLASKNLADFLRAFYPRLIQEGGLAIHAD